MLIRGSKASGSIVHGGYTKKTCSSGSQGCPRKFKWYYAGLPHFQDREDHAVGSMEITLKVPVNHKGTEKLHSRNQEQVYNNQLRQYCEHVVYLLMGKWGFVLALCSWKLRIYGMTMLYNQKYCFKCKPQNITKDLSSQCLRRVYTESTVAVCIHGMKVQTLAEYLITARPILWILLPQVNIIRSVNECTG